MAFHILVVDPDPASRGAIESALSAGQHLVTYVTGFEEAKERLEYALPDLLITAVRLGAYNGLHLVLRGHAERPDLPVILMHSEPDPILADEARDAGAIFFSHPFDAQRFTAIVQELLGTRGRPSTLIPRRWPRKQVAVPAKVGSNEATVVDVSYGGLRIEIDGLDQPLARLATVEIASVGAVPVHPVWARGGGIAGRWWCGAELDATDEDASDVWRSFVDSLN